MKEICVITGGGSGMGLETAKIVGKNQKVILCGRTVSKLENAINELTALGIDAEAHACDVSSLDSVKELAEYAASQGTVKTVINSAGVARGDAQKIFAINAVGTVYVNNVFAPIIADNGVILNVASMAGHMLAEENVPYQLFELALTDPEAFRAGGRAMVDQLPKENQDGAAYTISKKFVIWFTQKKALEVGERGVRVISISPGTFETPMVVGDSKEGREQSESFGRMGALGRVGEPIEIARVMAFLVSDDNSYMTGTDLLYDGGVIAKLSSMKFSL